MAVDMFMDMEGVKGESQDQKHSKTIDVLAWSWGMAQSGTTHMGTGGGAGRFKCTISRLPNMSTARHHS